MSTKASPLARFGTSGPCLTLHEFLPRLEKHLEEAYGPPVYSFRTGKDTTPQPPCREEVRAALSADGLSGSALKRSEVATLGDNRKVYTRLKRDHALAVGKAFAAVLNCLTHQGKEAVRSHKAFAAARSTDDLVKLREIVVETHGTTYGMSKTAPPLLLRPTTEDGARDLLLPSGTGPAKAQSASGGRQSPY
jgi:hypothetical protein